MNPRLYIPALALCLLCTPAFAQDIVWPSYKSVKLDGDTHLTCARLGGEIAHVSADIGLIRHAQLQIEKNIGTLLKLQNSRDYGYHAPLMSSHTGDQMGAYIAARRNVEADMKNADARRDYLTGLQATCKAGP